jgi:hypothetical protein
MRKTKPATVKDMARRRGLHIRKAMCGGWFVTLISSPEGFNNPSPVLYATHDWNKAHSFVRKQPIIISREESDE